MLLILDGYGYSEETFGNAIYAAKTPVFDNLWQNCPHTLLNASGLFVGLPDGQMGNSEVGHLHIGAGRLAPQDLTRINMAIDDGSFFENKGLKKAINSAISQNSKIHIFGLLSDGGIHSHINHIKAVFDLAKKMNAPKVFMHAFLDGRDTPPKSAEKYLNILENHIKGSAKIASISGRFYAMDRDKRYDRVQLAYDMLTTGKAQFYAKNSQEAIQNAYLRGETDEFVKPTLIEKDGVIADNDVVIFMNFRSDRGREISQAFTDENFTGFPREKRPVLLDYVTLTQYASDLKVSVAFPPVDLRDVLGSVVAQNNLTQLRIAETEKYAHVTYFLNGGEEKTFSNEDRILVPSPKVATYDLAPRMSLDEVGTKVVEAINSRKYDVIICNFANPDMIGHTGKFDATVEAIEAVDENLGKVVDALAKNDGELLIIADHGNAEKMIDKETGNPHTAHTCALVPFIYVGKRDLKIVDGNRQKFALTDVAPTMLYLLGIKQPALMTGRNLLVAKN